MTLHHQPDYGVVDLFAGPGGWDEGAASIGVRDILGIEWCADACATAEAAGHARLHADIAELDPLDFSGIDGLIASPPCQAWSSAGKRGAEFDRPLVAHVLEQLAKGRDVRAKACADAVDARSILVAEPLRWALALRPRWIACEQVEPAIEAWHWTAEHLRAVGYSTWTGVLSAERYGVPQTRRRAILMACLDRVAAPPMPTHQAFRAGEPARAELTMEGELQPWISMEQALGWGFEDQPAPTVTTGGGASGGGIEVFGNQDTRKRLAMVANAQANACVRSCGEPAPTIKGGHDYNDRRWLLDEGVLDLRQSENAGARSRPVAEPAPTITGTMFGRGVAVWSDQRTTAPVTLEEALVLQGFRADYPIAGKTKVKRFEQVGNAVPPPLAAAVLRAVGAVRQEAAA